MPLIYSFVSRGAEGSHVILAEYTPFSGNFNTVALEILQKISNPDSKFTIACDKHTFNFLVNNGFTYLVVADEEYGRQIPFAFLERVNGEFEEKMTEKGATASAHSHMEYCMAHPDEISKIASVQKKVNDVKDVMMENIEKVLERGEKIELMVDKADELQTQDVMMENIEKVLERGEKIELMVDKADELQTQIIEEVLERGEKIEVVVDKADELQTQHATMESMEKVLERGEKIKLMADKADKQQTQVRGLMGEIDQDQNGVLTGLFLSL
eukprot:gene12282-15431_t